MDYLRWGAWWPFLLRRVAECLADVANFLVGQVGIHGEAESLGGDFLGNGKVAGLMAEVREDGLEMERDRVVGDGGDVLVCEAPVKGVTVVGEDGVLSVDGSVPFGDGWKGERSAGEVLVVGVGDRLTLGDFVVKDIELGENDGCLEGVESPVDAEDGVMVFFCLAVDADLPHAFG